MPLKTKVLISKSSETISNLAIEEALLDQVATGEEILFLYENELSVVIGRFQNPWREYRTGLARRDGTPVYRRISGGGTVVHGPGNLNFSIITGSRVPDREKNLDRVISVVTNLGVDIFRNDRFDLRIHSFPAADNYDKSGLKVSGSAFRQTSAASMHHATLLVNADLEKLKVLLHQAPRDMTVKGVASVSSPVMNLADRKPEINTENIIQALSEGWGGEIEETDGEAFAGKSIFLQAKKRLESTEWTWSKTPAFTERFTGLPADYGEAMELEIKEGRIVRAPKNASFLIGCNYNGPEILATVDTETPPWLVTLASKVDGDG